MRSPQTLRQFMAPLLPEAGECARQASWQLVRAMLLQFTTNLAQLARQAGRATSAKVARQFFDRWFERSHWKPEEIYGHLNREVRRALPRRGCVPVLIDFTYLKNEWAVVQVSIGFQARALPIYRAVVRRRQGERKGEEAALLREACQWVYDHMPGPASRYVLVMDRGLPSHEVINWANCVGLRFVFRVRGEWKVTHPDYCGALAETVGQEGLVGPVPRLLRDAVLGQKNKGRDTSSRANVVLFHGTGYKEPWFLVTSEPRAARAVRIYRQRMRIECEFRDLKGPLGLDELASWEDVAHVGRFLAWVAVYEWWLALLWLEHRLEEWRSQVEVKGRLSWIRITREWLQQQVRAAAFAAVGAL